MTFLSLAFWKALSLAKPRIAAWKLIFTFEHERENARNGHTRKVSEFHVKIVSKVQSMRCSQREITNKTFSHPLQATKRRTFRRACWPSCVFVLFSVLEICHTFWHRTFVPQENLEKEEDAKVHRFYPGIINEEYYMTVFFPFVVGPVRNILSVKMGFHVELCWNVYEKLCWVDKFEWNHGLGRDQI